MSLGHALPAITFVSFVCNKYGLPNSNRCFSETRKQSNGQLAWFDMCCPVGCVFKNCKCLPSGFVGPNYDRQSIARCTRGIRPLRSKKTEIKHTYPGHIHFGRTSSSLHNLGLGSNNDQFYIHKNAAAYRRGPKIVHTSDRLPRTFLRSRKTGNSRRYQLNWHKQYPTVQFSTRTNHHSEITHGGSFYNPTLSKGSFKTVYKNTKYVLPTKKYRKEKLRYGRYGEKMNKKNYLKFKKNLDRANGHTSDYLNSETYVQTKIGGNHDKSGYDVKLNVNHDLRMRKYGDVYGKKRPKSNIQSQLTHTHYTHDHDHYHHHGLESGTFNKDKTSYIDPRFTGTETKTAAARKETIEIIDTSGFDRSGTTNNQISGINIGGSDTSGGFNIGKNVDVTFIDNKVILNNNNDGFITSGITDKGSDGSGKTFVDHNNAHTSQGIGGGTTLIDRTSETRGNIGVIDASSSGTGDWNSQTGTATNINGNVGRFEVDNTFDQGIGGGNNLIDKTSETSGNWWELEGSKIDTSSSGVGGGNTQIGSTTNTVGNVATIDGTLIGNNNNGQTFERGSLVNIRDNTHVDNSNRNEGNSVSSGTKIISSSTSSSKVVTDQSHTRITNTKTTVHGNTNVDSSFGDTIKHAQTVHIGGPEHVTIDTSSGHHNQHILTDKSQQTTSIGGSLTKDLEANRANIRDGNKIFASSGSTGTSSTDASSTSQHVKVIKAVDNSFINSGSSISSGTSSSVVDNTAGGIVRNANVDNTGDNRGQSLTVDATFPVIGGGRTAEQRREEVIIKDDTYLSPDICIECEVDDGGIGYIYHPEHCDMFVMCIPTIDGKMTPVSQVCPHGQFWDQSSLTCRPSRLTVCPLDICYKRKTEMEGRTYAHRTNCRSYWKCSNGYSLEKCCPKGQAYSPHGGCVPDSTCDVLCGREMEKPTEPVDRCTRRGVKGNPRKYEWDTPSGWIPMNCPPGTIFKDELCECVYSGNPIPGTLDPAYDPLEPEVCTPDVHLTFDDFMDHSGKNSYVYNSNVTLDGYGAGCFDGNSAISLPMFTNMHLGEKMYAKITYKQPYTRENQALLYNGDCVKRPSLVVTSSTKSNKVQVTSSYQETSQMDLASSTRPDEWRHVIININGKELIGNTGQDRKKVIVQGGVARTQCGLKIGWGKDFPGFVGCIDDFILYRCFPGKI